MDFLRRNKCYNIRVEKLKKLIPTKLFSRKPKKQTILALDVGSTTVGGVLFESAVGQDPKILKLTISKEVILGKSSIKSLWPKIQKELEIIVEQIFSKSGKRPDKVVIVLSSPWYFAQTRAIKMQREKPVALNEELLDELIKDEVEIFKRRSLKGLGVAEGDIEVAESEIMRAQLNGYIVDDFFGKTTKDIKFDVYISSIIKILKEDIKDFFKNEYGLGDIVFHTFPHVAHSSLLRFLNAKEGFLAIDIGGELTEIIVIKGELIDDIVSFPLGVNALVRKISHSLDINVSQSVSLLKTFSFGEMTESKKKLINESIENFAGIWKNSFKKALGLVSEDFPLPTNIFLIGGGANLVCFKEVVGGEEFSQFTFLGKPFNVQTVLPKAFQERIVGDISAQNPGLVALTLLIIFADNLVKKKEKIYGF